MQVRVQQTIWQFFSQQQVATLEGWVWLEVWIHPSPPPLGTVGGVPGGNEGGHAGTGQG